MLTLLGTHLIFPYFAIFAIPPLFIFHICPVTSFTHGGPLYRLYLLVFNHQFSHPPSLSTRLRLNAFVLISLAIFASDVFKVTVLLKK